MTEKKEEIKATTPSVNVMVERSLANFSKQQGVQKLWSLLEATELLKQFMVVNEGEEFVQQIVNEELSKVKFSKTKDYKNMLKFIEKARKKFNEAQIVYDIMRNKKQSDRSFSEKVIAKKISPYQKELYFLFMVLLKRSSFQNKTISRELLRSPEEVRMPQKAFEKRGVTQVGNPGV